MAMYGHIWPYMAMHGHRWASLALHGHFDQNDHFDQNGHFDQSGDFDQNVNFDKNGNFDQNGYLNQNGHFDSMAISSKMAMSTDMAMPCIMAISTKNRKNRCRFIRSIRDSLLYPPLAPVEPEIYRNWLFLTPSPLTLIRICGVYGREIKDGPATGDRRPPPSVRRPAARRLLAF